MGPTGEYLKWDPMHIPSTKPFVNISTSPEEPLSADENMNFVKTRSLVYSPFHSSARYINFEVGYSKDARWLSSIDDKWSDYANFFVGGFLEAIYPTNDKTYVQIDAKLIDYDTRFRNPNSQNPNSQPNQPVSPKSVNAFALRRNKSVPKTDSIMTNEVSAVPKTDSIMTNETSADIFVLKTPDISRNNSMMIDTPDISRNNSMMIDDTQDNNATPIVINDDESSSQPVTDDEEQLSEFMSYYKKFKEESRKKSQSSMTPTSISTATAESEQTSTSTPVHATPVRKTKKRQLADLCDEPTHTDTEEPNEQVVNQKRIYKRTGGRGRGCGRGKKNH